MAVPAVRFAQEKTASPTGERKFKRSITTFFVELLAASAKTILS
jgi:hypothetical protein